MGRFIVEIISLIQYVRSPTSLLILTKAVRVYLYPNIHFKYVMM